MLLRALPQILALGCLSCGPTNALRSLSGPAGSGATLTGSTAVRTATSGSGFGAAGASLSTGARSNSSVASGRAASDIGSGAASATSGGDGATAAVAGATATGITAAGAASSTTGTPDPCAGISCNSHGSCAAVNNLPTCQCEPGYVASGATCMPLVSTDPCTGITCSGFGTCGPIGGVAVCTCDPGYLVSGLNCVSTTGPDPCAGVTCNGQGQCLSGDGVVMCLCNPGYVANQVPTNCVPAAGTPCDGVSCGPGTCELGVIGTTNCSCSPGYRPYGMQCVDETILFCRDYGNALVPRGTTRCSADDLSIEVCNVPSGGGPVTWIDGVACNAGTTCSTGCLNALCPDQPCPTGMACLTSTHGIAVNECVVSCDCSNCGNCDPSSPFPGEQAYCGNTSGAPALTACNIPCPSAGDGCIPYDPPLCYPIEGCFSGAP